VVEQGGAAAARVIEHGAIGTRLGEGLQPGGDLGAAAMERTIDAVAALAERAHAHEARVCCIATSAMRRGANGAAFAARVARVAGAEPVVLPGSEEAAASFAGATYFDAPAGARIAVLDVGGGSTECALGRDGAVEQSVSLEIGSVRLAERFAATLGGATADDARTAGRAAREAAAAVLAPLARFPRPAEVRAVAGTPLTLGAIAFGLDAEGVSGRTLARAEIDALIERLLALDLAARKALPGMIAQRADILPAGAIIVSEALRLLGCDAARLEANDLLLGYLLRTGADDAPA
jgi:exopolyphosphatase / guanosine-5'-triphosphate,3'-diphosphate pyrophosphatase